MNARTLQRSMPGLPAWKAREYAPLLNAAMREGQITTRARAAAFLAQLGHESGSLRWMEELASGSAYEGRRDLGNTQPGDGRRYKGRGPIQLTGRANYRAAGNALGLALEREPTLVSRPGIGFRVAVWYWTTHGLNAYADGGDFDRITLVINGGFNGLTDRRHRYGICRALGEDILPEDSNPLTKQERSLLARLRYHHRRGEARWTRYYVHRLARHARHVQRVARAGRGGWTKDRRGERFQLIRKTLKGLSS
jgi:predicted chitinase